MFVLLTDKMDAISLSDLTIWNHSCLAYPFYSLPLRCHRNLYFSFKYYPLTHRNNCNGTSLSKTSSSVPAHKDFQCTGHLLSKLSTTVFSSRVCEQLIFFWAKRYINYFFPSFL